MGKTAISKAIEIIKNTKAPPVSVEGRFMKFPPTADLRRNIPNETQRKIFVSAFKDLELLNRNFISYMPLLLAYSQEMAQYHILKEKAGDEITNEYRGDERLNPMLVQANRCLDNALKVFKHLGLDAITRHRIGKGPGAIEKNKSEFEI